MNEFSPCIRRAKKADAWILASLIDLAGQGMPAHLWSQMKSRDQSAIDFGAVRTGREEGIFSYKNAWVSEVAGEAAAMILGYSQPVSTESDSLQEHPEFIRPIVELESMAPSSWHISTLATVASFRQRGLGYGLLRFIEGIAENENCDQLSLITSTENSTAIRLYERFHFRPKASRPMVPPPGFRQLDDWVLMVKSI